MAQLATEKAREMQGKGWERLAVSKMQLVGGQGAHAGLDGKHFIQRPQRPERGKVAPDSPADRRWCMSLVFFLPLTPFCCPRGPSAGRPKPGPDYAGMSGHAASKRRGGRCFGEKVTEERRISVDIGCTRERQGKEAGREGAGSGKGEQGGPPKHVSRYACTL